jgi:thioesterase domain-containing protein/acyl carrier protein
MTAPAAVASSLQALVAEAWQQALKIKQLDPAQSWQDAGGDSLGILQLLLKIERRCGCVLSFDMIDPAMRVGELVALIEQGPHFQESALPLVHLLPGFLGDEPSLASFRRALHGRIAFNLLDIADLNEPAAVLKDMQQIGSMAALAIERRQPSGPIVLAGYSFGGSVAYEAARSLINSGREVALLAIFDSKFGVAASGVGRTSAQSRTWKRRSRLRAALSWDFGRASILAALNRMPWSFEHRIRRYLFRLFREDTLHSWSPAPLDVDTFLAVSNEYQAKTLGIWRWLCPRLNVARLPGAHTDIFQAPAATLLIPAFEDHVRRAITDNSKAASKPSVRKYREPA